MRHQVLEVSTLLIATIASAEGTKNGLWLQWHGPVANTETADVAHVDDQGFVELPGRNDTVALRVPREQRRRRPFDPKRAAARRQAIKRTASEAAVGTRHGQCMANIGDHLAHALHNGVDLAGTPPPGISAAEQAQLDLELAAIASGKDI